MEGVSIMIKYFTLESSMTEKGKFLIKVNPDLFPLEKPISGCLNLLPARLLGLSYADYLRFARDVLDAKVIGKNELYPTPYFSGSDAIMELVKLLNKRMQLIMYDREHPYIIKENEDGKLEKVPRQ